MFLGDGTEGIWDREAQIIETLKELQRSTEEESLVRMLLREIAYFGKNRSGMSYLGYRARGLPIGGGTVESTCKNAVGGRMKQGGMPSSPSGADGMTQIRFSRESDRLAAPALTAHERAPIMLVSYRYLPGTGRETRTRRKESHRNRGRGCYRQRDSGSLARGGGGSRPLGCSRRKSC